MSSWNPLSLIAQQTGGLTWTNLRISTMFSLPLCILSLTFVGPPGKSDLSHPGDIFQFFRGVRSFYSYAKLQSKVTTYRFVALCVFSSDVSCSKIVYCFYLFWLKWTPMCVYMYMCVRVCMCIHMDVCMGVLYMHVHVCIYMSYIHIYVKWLVSSIIG